MVRMCNIVLRIHTRFNQYMRWLSTISNDKNFRSTVYPNEVTKFGNLKNIWWDDDGPMRFLHLLNAVRLPFIQEGLEDLGKLSDNYLCSSTPLKDLNILDVGCGGGFLCEALAQLGANVTGIDASKELIQVAKVHSVENSKFDNEISYIHAPIEDMRDKYINYFDVVVASEIIEHVASMETFIKSCTDVLKPGGSIFLTTFNKTITSWIGAILLMEYVLKILPIGTHEWDKFVSPLEVQSILKEYNCDTHLVQGFIYFGGIWCWSKSTSFRYGLHAVKRMPLIP